MFVFFVFFSIFIHTHRIYWADIYRKHTDRKEKCLMHRSNEMFRRDLRVM